MSMLCLILLLPARGTAQISIMPGPPTISSATYNGQGTIFVQWSSDATATSYQIRWQKGPEVTANATQSKDTGFYEASDVAHGNFRVLESQPGPYSFTVQSCSKVKIFSSTCSAWSFPATVTIPQPRLAVQSVSFNWNDLSRGDCRLQNGSVVFKSDGSAIFTAMVKTDRTHSGDIWHADISGLNSSSKVVVDLGTIDSPTMSDDHGWYNWSHAFNYNGMSFITIKTAKIHSSC